MGFRSRLPRCIMLHPPGSSRLVSTVQGRMEGEADVEARAADAAREIKERVALAKADGVTTPNLLMKMPKKKRREREKPVRIKVKDVREESVGHAETKKTRSLKRKRKKSDSLMMIIFNSSKQRTRTCLQLKEDNMRKSLTRNSKKTRSKSNVSSESRTSLLEEIPTR